jgi:sugar phosphate isomerase/epimerase
MNEPMHAFMKLGTVHHVSYPFSGSDEQAKLDSLKKLLCDPCFDAIEVGHFADAEVRRQAIAMIRTAHLQAVAFGGQGITLGRKLNINDVDETQRRIAVDALKAGIDEAYEFGSDYFAFLAGRYESGSIEQSFEALLQSVDQLCAHAKQGGGMVVEIEVFDSDIDKRSLIGPSQRVVRLAETMCPRWDNFAIQVDSSHIPLLLESNEEHILPIIKHIRHVHMGNAVMRDKASPAYGDNHPRFGYPGGENDTAELAAYLRVLLNSGFLNKQERPLVSFEVKPQVGEDPDLVLANAKRTLREAWLHV